MQGPLLCDPAEKPQREAANSLEQLDYIAYLVNDLGIRGIGESHIRELHRLCVEGIYPCAGRYRAAVHDLEIKGSGHSPPQAASVVFHIRELLDWINQPGQHLLRAAYALWRLNWIHPFAGGNGRTARALCYLVLCSRYQMMFPGNRTFPTVIAESYRDRYLAGLQEADRGETAGEDPSEYLRELTDLLLECLMVQIGDALERLQRRARKKYLRRRRRQRIARRGWP